MMDFSTPYALLLLPVTAVLWYLRELRPRLRDSVGNRPAMRVALWPGESERIPVSLWSRLEPLAVSLPWLAALLLALSLAGPRLGVSERTIMTEGVNIVLAVDASESMAALDFTLDGDTVSRLEAVKGVVRQFVQGRAGDRVGLVVFGSEAYTQVPLTRDYETLLYGLDRLDIGAAGKQTAIGDALGISLKRIKRTEDKAGESEALIILLTDGRSNTGQVDPHTAMRLAEKAGVTVYTIGVGGRGPAPFVINDPMFGRRVIRRRVDIDEDTLIKIAKNTGGLYFRAENTDALAEIYAKIDELEPTPAEVKTYVDYEPLYPYLLGPALGLLALWLLLMNTRLLRIP